MKKQTGQDERGFTLVELLIVTFMLGMVMTALYSVYTSHQRTAYTSDETVEVQQNLRIAMDSISRDIRTAGLLLQTGVTGTSPISAGTTASKIFISSGCPSGIITRITPTPSPKTGTASPNTFTVDNDGSVSAFSNNDYVRIIRPVDKTQPGGTDRIYQVSGTPGVNSITLNNGDWFSRSEWCQFQHRRCYLQTYFFINSCAAKYYPILSREHWNLPRGAAVSDKG